MIAFKVIPAFRVCMTPEDFQYQTVREIIFNLLGCPRA